MQAVRLNQEKNYLFKVKKRNARTMCEICSISELVSVRNTEKKGNT